MEYRNGSSWDEAKSLRSSLGARRGRIRAGKTVDDYRREQGITSNPINFDAGRSAGDRPSNDLFGAFDASAFGNIPEFEPTPEANNWNVGRKDERNMSRTNLNRR